MADVAAVEAQLNKARLLQMLAAYHARVARQMALNGAPLAERIARQADLRLRYQRARDEAALCAR